MENKASVVVGDVEKRKFTRLHTLLSGSLIDGDRSAHVAVFDVSVNGAELRLLAEFECSDTVNLKIDRFGMFPAEVIWRKGNHLGLKFVDAPETIARMLPEAFASKLSDKSCGAAVRGDGDGDTAGNEGAADA